MRFVVALSLFFAVSRFFVEGHTVSKAGSWEALAHVWMGAVLMLAGQQTIRWLMNRGWSVPRPLWVYGEPFEYSPAVMIHAAPPKPGNMPFPWLLHACWLAPSTIELVLFLAGPFNPLQ